MLFLFIKDYHRVMSQSGMQNDDMFISAEITEWIKKRGQSTRLIYRNFRFSGGTISGIMMICGQHLIGRRVLLMH